VLVLLLGLALWSTEAEYGSGLNYTIVVEGETATVYEETAGEVAQFDSNEEAVAYTEEKRAEGANYLIPGLVIAAGAALIVVGLVSVRRTKQEAPPIL
jgi:hypothetical protein